MILLFSAAYALPPQYPWCAPVDLPGTTVRIEVPPELRSVDDPQDGSDLVLVSASGDAIPFARVEGDPGAADVDSVGVIPTLEERRFAIDLGARPVDLLRVHPPAGVLAMQVTAMQDGQVLAGPSFVWELAGGQQTDVPLAGASGLVQLVLAPVGTWSRAAAPAVEAVRLRGPVPNPDRIEVELSPGVQQENGWTRYTATLPRPLPVDRFVLAVDGEVFQRNAGAEALSVSDVPSDVLGAEGQPDGTVPIQRIAVGPVSVESTTVRGRWTGADRYALYVSVDGREPLDVTGAVAEVDRVELLVLSSPTGRATLCGGAPPYTAPGSDLSLATPELLREARTAVRPGPIAPNPDWVAPEVAANLVAPGAEIELAPFRWKRAVEGEGLSRIPLDAATLSAARPDLGDLRLVQDARQIPYILRRVGADPVVEGVATERWEEGATSWIRVKLPQRGLPLARVVIRSPAPVFDRDVSLNREDGGSRVILRRLRWVAKERQALSIEIPGPVDDTLLLAVENGDDPPLPLEDELQVTSAAWEVIAVLPAGGATLVYGAPTVSRPDYDLALLEGEVRRRATAQATVGPAVPASRGRLTTMDRVLLAGGVAILALGLLALVVELLRRMPAQLREESAREESTAG